MDCVTLLVLLLVATTINGFVTFPKKFKTVTIGSTGKTIVTAAKSSYGIIYDCDGILIDTEVINYAFYINIVHKVSSVATYTTEAISTNGAYYS